MEYLFNLVKINHFWSWKLLILINFDDILQKMFVIAVKFGKTVRYIHENFMIKHAKPN